MRSDSAQGQTYQVIASTQDWQGTTAQLAHLLARRLGQEEAALTAALERAQRAEVAQGVEREQAERLRELLARMGVHAELVGERREARPQLQKTQMDWHTFSEPQQPAPPPRRPESGDTRVEASATLEELTDAWANVDVQDLPVLLAEAPPAPSQTPLPAHDPGWANALRPVNPPRPDRQNTFDTDFKTLWDRLVPEEAPAPEPPTVIEESEAAEAGWEAILGSSPPSPAPAPQAPFDRERLTGQWEVVIQSDDHQDSFTLQPPEPAAPPQRAPALTPPPAPSLAPTRRTPTPSQRLAPAPTPQAPRWRALALWALLALLALGATAQVGRWLWKTQWGGQEPRAEAAARAERRLQARGAAEVEVSRALYRAEREQEEAPIPAQTDNPIELRRRSLQLTAEGRSACANGDFLLCQRLAEEAISLDATNKDAWGLVVKAREQSSRPPAP